MSQADQLLLLADECAALQAAAAHLGFSLERTRALIPRLAAPLSPEELERLESLASRFARLADLLTQRVLRLIDTIELAPAGTLLDRIHRAEKRGWTASATTLVRIRELRNLIAHEYAAENLPELYETVFTLSPELIDIANRAQAGAQTLMARLQGNTP